ncbi:MAG TPA: prepilin-type N-terminal cleavage/methylation domain-containing protein [Candidatus Saccharimonadales bacterium]
MSYHTLTHQPKQKNKQAGFTIVEIMIATLVFTVILMVITYGVMHFTSDYFKGINSSTTQTVARTALDDITQAIEYSSGPITSAANGVHTAGLVCAGNQAFGYMGGKIVVSPTVTPNSGNTTKALIDHTGVSSTCTPAAVGSGTELLQNNMRLVYLTVSQVASSSNLWTVQLSVAYGDSDLLCDASANSTHLCSPGGTPYALTDSVWGPDILCKTDTGDQFCSVVNLSTTVSRRLN